jgi:hypothetical protein
VASSEPKLRCALPATETIDLSYSFAGRQDYPRILAVDGSQAFPDRHEEVLFGLINIGAVSMEPGSGKAPQIDVDTSIMFGSELYLGDGPMISEGEMALLRDSGERAVLLRRASAAQSPGIALTDGPLELWGAKDVPDPGAYEKALSEYLGILRELQRRGWTVAGYVDKPAADLVVRTLEIVAAGPDVQALRNHRPLRGASDRWLFSQILGPGQRSAVFAMQSASSGRYDAGISLHFFYLNVGERGHPWVARVEIPRWVAESEPRTHALHQTLLEQSRMLGARPYPYVLHRAHEAARISVDEKQQIKLKILMAMRRRGVEPDKTSAKASAKVVSEVKGSWKHG